MKEFMQPALNLESFDKESLTFTMSLNGDAAPCPINPETLTVSSPLQVLLCTVLASLLGVTQETHDC